MDVMKSLDLASRKYKEEEQNRQLNLEKNSKLKIQEVISTKLRTTFIGALSSIEESFGFLWGDDEDDSKLTPTQLKWKEIWVDCRTRILNNGNSQLRAIKNELKNYIVVLDQGKKIISKEDNNGY